MKIKNMLFIVIVFAGLFISVVACQAGADEDVAEIVVVEKTAVYTPTSEPIATETAVPIATKTPSPTPTTEPTITPPPTATALPPTNSLSMEWLVTTDELDTLTKEVGIMAWETEAEWLEVYEVCRTYLFGRKLEF